MEEYPDKLQTQFDIESKTNSIFFKPRFCYCLLFIFQMIALSSFTFGFLQVRDQLNNHSTNVPMTNEDKWFEPQTQKIIMILLDALRFEFIYSNDNMTSNECSSQFQNLRNLMAKEPDNFVLFRAFAEIPTVTTQKIKCLMTGNLPPFVEIIGNFGGLSHVVEDTVLYQIAASNKRVYMSGDEMWLSVFGKDVFSVVHPFDSFEVRDLHSLDNNVKKDFDGLFSNDPWNLIILHMLGIDHAGHTFYMCHKEMLDKMKELDTFLSHIIEKMDNDTVLILLGDHGMTPEGDHGGGSVFETNTVLLYYTKKGFEPLKKHYPELLEYDSTYLKTLNQVHFAASLSFLFGIPIPFSNVGIFSNDLYINNNRFKTKEDLLAQILHDNYINYKQISHYINELQNEYSEFDIEIYNNLFKDQYDIDEKYDEILNYMKLDISRMNMNNTLDINNMKKYYEKLSIDLILKIRNNTNEIFQLVKSSLKYDYSLMFLGLIAFANVAFYYHFYQGYANNIIYIRNIIKNKDFYSIKIPNHKHPCNLVMRYLPYIIPLPLCIFILFLNINKLSIFMILFNYCLLGLMIYCHVKMNKCTNVLKNIINEKRYVKHIIYENEQDHQEMQNLKYTTNSKNIINNNNVDPVNDNNTNIVNNNDSNNHLENNISILNNDDVELEYQPYSRLSTSTIQKKIPIKPDNSLYINAFVILIAWIISVENPFVKNAVLIMYFEPEFLRKFIQLLFSFYLIYLIFTKIDKSSKKQAVISLFISSISNLLASYIRTLFVDQILNRILIATCIPSLIILYYMNKKLSKLMKISQIINQSKQAILFINILNIFNLINSLIYLILLDIIPSAETMYAINIIIPRISYSCFFVILTTSLYIFWDKLKIYQKYRVFFIAFTPVLLMLIGKMSPLIYLLYIICQHNVMKFTKRLKIRHHYSTYCLLTMIGYQFYFITGHTNYLQSIQYAAGFIGFVKCPLIISGILILINTYSPYIILILMVCYQDLKYLYYRYKDITSRKHELTFRCTYMIAYHFWGLFGTSITCLYNHQSLLLIYDCLPKFLIDAVAFIFIHAILNIIIFISFL